MSRKGETPPDPRDALIGSLDTGQTGCFVGRAGTGARYRVYVMLGEILAAHAGEDDRLLLARVKATGLLDGAEIAALRARVDTGAPLVESLFDVLPENELLELLFERFRDNLLGFLGAEEVEEFQTMDAVFTDNIQVGHDSRVLVDELVSINARVAGLRAQPGMILAPGAAAAITDREKNILARCADRIRLSELLDGSVYEPVRTLEVVQDMLDQGMLVGLVPQSRRRGATERAESPAPVEVAPAEPAPSRPAPIVEIIDDMPDTLVVEHPAEWPAAPDAAPVVQEPVVDEPVADEPTVDEPIRNFGYPQVDDEDDLAAFQDYDTYRGGGAFLTDRSLLDRVDLEGGEAAPRQELVASTETLIEMEDADGAGKEDALRTAVSLNFSGPKLQDAEIQRKLGVTNDVLATIGEAIEAVEGRGSGQARLQLLVEGTSVPLAPLFKGVELSQDGRLPVALVVKNLRKRPAGEHRRLLNRGLSDLIERALSAAYEILDEEGLEAMLERIAGYQQRLGV